MADAVLVGTRGSTSTSTAVSGSGTSTASGSTFVIALAFDSSVTVSTVSDSKGNSYTQIGTPQTHNSMTVAMYRAVNATGGTNHTATATFSGAAHGTIYLIELTGVTTSSFDQTAAANDFSSPFTVTTPTLSQADEVIVTILVADANVNPHTFSSSNTTIIDQEPDADLYWCSAISKVVVASTSAFTPSFTSSILNREAALKTATFRATAAGGNQYTLTAEQGSYSYTGQQATLVAGNQMTAEHGTYTLLGSEALRDIEMDAEQGSYALNGQTSEVLAARELVAESGSYQLNGPSVNLLYSAVLIVTEDFIRNRRRMIAGRGFPFLGRF